MVVTLGISFLALLVSSVFGRHTTVNSDMQWSWSMKACNLLVCCYSCVPC